MFDYIICFYFGERRAVITNALLRTDKYHFVKKHLIFINDNILNMPDLNSIIFVINNVNNFDCENVTNIVNTFPNIKDRIKIIGRCNDNYSYGGWNEALIKNIDSISKYAFLCEDDYIPAIPDFYKHFINYFSAGVVYVCQLYRDNHASISNGFMSLEKCVESYVKYGSVFKLTNFVNTYTCAEVDQVNFLKYFDDYIKLDICDKYLSKFYEFYRTTNYGNSGGIELIKPILE